MLVDAIGAAAQGWCFRFSRILRPALIILYTPHTARQLQSMLWTLPHVMDVAVFTVLLVFVYAIVGVQVRHACHCAFHGLASDHFGPTLLCSSLRASMSTTQGSH